ncbi:MAG: hypothetical protein ACPGSD_00145 [Flavobacteriales bacterium]
MKKETDLSGEELLELNLDLIHDNQNQEISEKDLRSLIEAIIQYAITLNVNLNDVQNKLSEVILSISSKNLFNESDVQNDHLLNNSGSIGPGANWTCSGYIPIQANQTYTLSGPRGRQGIAYYESKNGIAIAGSYNGSVSSLLTTTAPPNANFCCFNLESPSAQGYSSIQFELNENATNFVPFGDSYKINPSAIVAPEMIEGVSIDLKNGDLESTIVMKSNGNTLKYNILPFREYSQDRANIFGFRDVYFNEVLVNQQNDIAAPYRVMGVTIGANHGYVKTRITHTNHGKTFTDVGSIWSDGVDEFVICGIVNENLLEVTARSNNAGLIASSIIHVSGATNTNSINSSNKIHNPFHPAIQNRNCKCYVDNLEVSEEKLHVGEKVVFVESYEIMDKASISEWLITQVGTSTEITEFGGVSKVKVTNTYEFTKYGTIVMYQDFLALDNITNFQDIMFNMNTKIEGDYSFYVPKSIAFDFEGNNYNFSKPTNISNVSLASRINFTQARTEASGILADRCLMLGNDVGFGMGFLPIQDTSIENRRVNSPNKALQISEAKKVYMSAIDGLKNTLEKGDYFSTIGYKTYFPMTENRTSYYTIPTNNETYLYADWHTNTLDILELPSEFIGKDFEIVEKSDNVNLLSKQNTGQLLVDVLAQENYGYMILKIKI